jgi:hypothetical protein
MLFFVTMHNLRIPFACCSASMDRIAQDESDGSANVKPDAKLSLTQVRRTLSGIFSLQTSLIERNANPSSSITRHSGSLSTISSGTVSLSHSRRVQLCHDKKPFVGAVHRQASVFHFHRRSSKLTRGLHCVAEWCRRKLDCL